MVKEDGEVTNIFSPQFFLSGCHLLLVVVCFPLNNVNLISLFKEFGLEIFSLCQQHTYWLRYTLVYSFTSFSLAASLTSIACSFSTISCCFSWLLARSLSSKLVCLRHSCTLTCCSLNRVIIYNNIHSLMAFTFLIGIFPSEQHVTHCLTSQVEPSLQRACNKQWKQMINKLTWTNLGFNLFPIGNFFIQSSR